MSTANKSWVFVFFSCVYLCILIKSASGPTPVSSNRNHLRLVALKQQRCLPVASTAVRGAGFMEPSHDGFWWIQVVALQENQETYPTKREIRKIINSKLPAGRGYVIGNPGGWKIWEAIYHIKNCKMTIEFSENTKPTRPHWDWPPAPVSL